LLDLEDYFDAGVSNHVTTVERVIGLKTRYRWHGGTIYLRRMLDVNFPGNYGGCELEL